VWCCNSFLQSFGEHHNHKRREGKGYGKKLLSHIEKVAKEHNVTTIKTSDIDPCDHRVVSFFKSMGYRFKSIEGDEAKFIEGEKPLENEILRLIRLIDKSKSKLFRNFDVFHGSRILLISFVAFYMVYAVAQFLRKGLFLIILLLVLL
jgi:hypothetical protein